MTKTSKYAKDDYVVYPIHGVGKVVGVETATYGSEDLELLVIQFEADRMILHVPVTKGEQSGLRHLSSPKLMNTALQTLRGRARVKRTMWSRRAQEYESKINSGDPISIAEVIRDLHRNAEQPDQSFSERQIYRNALGRLTRELAAIEQINEDQASDKLSEVLQEAA